MGHTADREAEQFELQLGDRGRIVLPAVLRQRLSLHPGDRMVLIVDKSGEMRLVDLRRQIEKCRGMFRHLAPRGKRLSDELIADRRKEAQREEEE
jgi:AbrB family looped-hinge helix DNA binding protein